MSEPGQSVLANLYASHAGKVSDKWALYLDVYSRLLDGYRTQPVRLLEIGIQNGGSLEIWGKYFPRARTLVGCDIDPLCANLVHDDQRVHVVVGDANLDDTEERIRACSPVYDIVIDDGSHRSSDICRSFGRYFPMLAPGGIFIVEDLHCSYWQHFEGGLFDPFSAIAFFKRLADVPNQEHWGVPIDSTAYLSPFFAHHAFGLDAQTLAQVHSVEFANSLCIVRKRAASENQLGLRVIAGSVEAVATGHLDWHGTAAPRVDQSANPWSRSQATCEEQLVPCAGLGGRGRQATDAERSSSLLACPADGRLCDEAALAEAKPPPASETEAGLREDNAALARRVDDLRRMLAEPLWRLGLRRWRSRRRKITGP